MPLTNTVNIQFDNVKPTDDLARVEFTIRELGEEPMAAMVDVTITDHDGEVLTIPISEIPIMVIFDNATVDISGASDKRLTPNERIRQAVLQRLNDAALLSFHRTPDGIVELRLDVGQRHFHAEMNRRGSRRFFA